MELKAIGNAVLHPRRALREKVDDYLLQPGRMDTLAVLFILPAILFLILISVIPILYAFYISLHEASIFSPEMTFSGLANYLELIFTPFYWTSIWLDVVFALGSTVLQIILGVMFAIVLNRSFRFVSWGRILAIFPYLVPTIAVALMWKWMLSPVFGVINAYAIQFGLISSSIEFFGHPDLAMPLVILANSWKFTSFAVIIFLARLQSIDEKLYEQAKISGASMIQMFTTVTYPHLRSAILLVFLLRGMFMFTRFDIIWLLTRGGPGDATTTLPVYIYEITFLSYDLGRGSAAAIMLFWILSAGAMVYFWYFQPSKEIGQR